MIFWNKLNAKDKKSFPRVGSFILAKLRHCTSRKIVLAELKRVNEDDCDFKTADDNSELAYEYNVIAWVYSYKL